MSSAGLKELPAYHPWREGRISSLDLILAQMPEGADERADLVAERDELSNLVERQYGLRRVQHGRHWFQPTSATKMKAFLLVSGGLAFVAGTGCWISHHLR